HLTGRSRVQVRTASGEEGMFTHGEIRLRTAPIHTVHALDVAIPKERLTVVTGVSGSGKSTLVLDSLVPALPASGGAPRGDCAASVRARDAAGGEGTFTPGALRLRTAPIPPVHALDVAIPKERLTVVTGVSGSGKSTLVLDSLVPALLASGGARRVNGQASMPE